MGDTVDSVSIGYAIATISALGTAAYGLVDALKLGRNGGLSNAGFNFIQRAMRLFFPEATRARSSGDVKRLLDALHGNWINGRPLAEQKAIAKSLIKLRLDAKTAARFADATDVDAAVLADVGAKMTQGAQLSDQEMNALGRFDLGLAQILDDCYQHADQRYRNTAKVWAMGIALVLALAGTWLTIDQPTMMEWVKAVIAGLIAAPLAPVAKDVASALQAGAKVAQLVRK